MYVPVTPEMTAGAAQLVFFLFTWMATFFSVCWGLRP